LVGVGWAGWQSTEPQKSYEVVELSYKFTGPWGWFAYQTALAIFMYIALLAYAQVRVHTRHVPWGSLNKSAARRVGPPQVFIVTMQPQVNGGGRP
jgi:hypothetical protein